MNNGRNASGIYVDKLFKNGIVYIGGGVSAEHKFEYYDISKNKWFKSSDTNKPHKFFPIIWCENKNILHIASTMGVEKNDLRENKWCNICIDNKSLNDLFGTTVQTTASCRFCIN